MRLTWKERLNQKPSLWSFRNWPVIPHDEIPKDKRKRFILNLQVVSLVLDRNKLESISRNHAIATSTISKLMTRCLAGDEEMDPPLTRALVPNTHLSKSVRQKELPTMTTPAGTSCAFSTLIYRLPGLKTHLDDHLIADIKDKPWGQNIRAKAFHSAFLEYLSQHQWPSDCYPYTESIRGYESCRRYLIRRRQELILRERKDNDTVPRVLSRRTTEPTCFGHIQLDEHSYDSPCTIHLSIDGRISPLRVSRASLIVAIEVSSNLILSYVLVLARAPNRHDVLKCLKLIYAPWSPSVFKTPGFRYITGAGFPMGVIFDEHSAPAIGEVSLDNALAHHANSVREFIVDPDYLGATFCTGIPVLPKARNWIEYCFSILTTTSHSLKSTSGTGPSDPRRESRRNVKNPPIISLVALEECIEMVFANENAKPRSTLRLESPLVDCESLLKNTYVPRLTLRNFQNISTSTTRVKLSLHREKDGATYVYFYYRKYTGKSLYAVSSDEKHIYAEYNNTDIRKITIINIHGEHIGIAYAPRTWQSYPHSIKTRNIIHKLTRPLRINTPDYLVWYYNYLLDHKKLPNHALELVRVHREFTDQSVHLKPVIDGEDIQDNNSPEIDLNDLEDFPEWSSEYFDDEDTNHEK